MIAQQNDEYLQEKLPVIKLGYDKLLKSLAARPKGREKFKFQNCSIK